jgi:hypothetical protein
MSLSERELATKDPITIVQEDAEEADGTVLLHKTQWRIPREEQLRMVFSVSTQSGLTVSLIGKES